MHFRSREKFTSRVTLDRPGSIDVEYIEGPMKYLHNDWRFRPDGKGGSIVDFNVEFAFRNRMLDTLAGRFFDEARSEEHTSELQSLMPISYAVFCLKTNKAHAHHRINISVD